MNAGAIQAIVAALTGGSLIALVTQLIRASGLWRSGRLASTREVIRDMASARDEAEAREDEQRTDSMYWQGVAAGYAFQLRQAGVEPNPPRPESPSAIRRRKDRASSRNARRDREIRASAGMDTGEIERIIRGDDQDRR